MLDAYGRHRDLLRLIGSPQPERRWLLKYPVHMGNLRALFKIYPDACIVQTHRDTSKVLPSICSLVAGWRAIYEYDVNRHEVAEWLLDLWSSRLHDGMQVRRERDAAQFFDLHFREILADPVGAAQRIYTYFDIEIGAEAEQRMRRWAADNPQGKHGEHHYRAEDFGLTDDAIAERFAAYLEHFQVERERSA